jgi:hypothetical protein
VNEGDELVVLNEAPFRSAQNAPQTQRWSQRAGSNRQLNRCIPAPSAVANAYINSSAGRTYLTGKQRGRVIPKVAEQHEKNAAYGPKGGPYQAHAFQQALGSFAGSCPA